MYSSVARGLLKPWTAYFVIIAQTSVSLPSICLRKMACASNESHIIKEKDSAKKQMWSAPEEKQLLNICSGIQIAEQLDNCISSANVHVSSAAHYKCSFTTLLGPYWITCKTLVE